MESNNQQVNPRVYRTPAEFRAQARGALRGNWRTVLGIMAIVTLIVGTITELMYGIGDHFLLSLKNNSEEIALLIPVSIHLIVSMLVLTLISPLSNVVLARITRRAVTGEKIDLSLMRLSWKELLRGIRVEWVVEWRVILIPLLPVYGLLVIDFISQHSGMKIPETIFNVMILVIAGATIAAVIWMMCRAMHYQPVYQLMVISPDAKARELADRSRELMNGNRLFAFGLNLSFFGWIMLYALFQGIGEELLSASTLWTALQIFSYACLFVRLPLDLYIQTALAAFTKDLLERG